MKLSFRNVKRQFDEYTLFFVTLTSTVASMYAFNALIFSDTVKALPEMELLPYLIIAASLLIILIMGWMISYMVNYILKRRSREFSVYMVSGIQNRKISTLFFYENSLIGLLAFFPGILLGMLISQILEAVLLNMFGLPYMLHLGFSLPALGLTFLYFSAMLLFSIRKTGSGYAEYSFVICYIMIEKLRTHRFPGIYQRFRFFYYLFFAALLASYSYVFSLSVKDMTFS